jgi:hypothetical protein
MHPVRENVPDRNRQYGVVADLYDTAHKIISLPNGLTRPEYAYNSGLIYLQEIIDACCFFQDFYVGNLISGY